MKPLVIAELRQGNLAPATRHVVTASAHLGAPVLLVAGHDCAEAAREGAHLEGVQTVLLADHPSLDRQPVENLAALVTTLAENHTHILAAANTFGHDLLPRVAGLLGVAMASQVVEILAPDRFVRPLHAGNLYATVRLRDQPILLTVRLSAFPPAIPGQECAPLEGLSVPPGGNQSRHLGFDPSPPSEQDLLTARVVVGGGHGLAAGGNFAPIQALAKPLQAAVGATRAAVDAGLAPNDWQIGQTGKSIAPDLYMAIGISGTIQHVAGIKDAKTIVAINHDPQAPIFAIADYGLTADLYTAIPDLLQSLKSKQMLLSPATWC
ncbi:MAG: electron transfer flavoprotein subunit alpha/FixB family protein [Magnetococcales bacterium]|nr:electron transfer flavoprotein subunit alpha/FixB family protein [Magnetococcales bacterium]